jgi:hypothetical protein
MLPRGKQSRNGRPALQSTPIRPIKPRAAALRLSRRGLQALAGSTAERRPTLTEAAAAKSCHPVNGAEGAPQEGRASARHEIRFPDRPR